MSVELWLKALHVTAMATWMAGMIVTPHLLAKTPDAEALAALRGQFSRIITPAMIATLALGLWLAQQSGWFQSAWLQLKLAVVVFLTAVHGIVSGQMRRLSNDPERTPPAWLGHMPFAVIAAIGAVAILAVVKPELWQ